jgi:hypothetical protein
MSERAISPKYRFRLKARIAEAGFRTMKDFAAAVGSDASRVSRIVGGYEFPSAKLASTMAEVLKVSHDDLKQML